MNTIGLMPSEEIKMFLDTSKREPKPFKNQTPFMGEIGEVIINKQN